MSATRTDTTAIVLAAGLGERLGADKALVELGDRTAIERLIGNLRAAGVDDVVVVRRNGAAPLPGGLDRFRLDCTTDAMIDTLRAALRARTLASRVLVFPVDYAMVSADTLRALLARTGPIVLPRCRGRVGHPLLLESKVLAEIGGDDVTSLRDVIRREPARVQTVDVIDGWIGRDLDTPADLAAARGHLRNLGAATDLMAAHRSRRAYRSDPVGDPQLRWIVDSARHASTSSFMQAYSVVAVRDPARRARIATLCADQDHIRQAPLFLAICADLHRIGRACGRHGRALNASSLEVFLEATIDACLFGQNLALAAESESLGICMIGAARDHPRDLAAELGLPQAVYAVFGMTLGWPADEPEPRGRLPLDSVLHFEHYGQSGVEAALDSADDDMRAWARRVNARRAETGARPIREDRAWTDRMAFLFGGAAPHEARTRLGAELRALGFGLDAPQR